MAFDSQIAAGTRRWTCARSLVPLAIGALRLLLVLLVVALMGCAGGRTAGTDDPGDASVDSAANISWQVVAAPPAISTAQRLVAADPTLKAMLAPAKKGWERDAVGATSPGWRATADKKFGQLSAQLGERANANFDVGLGRFERFGLRITREGATASQLELHEGRGVYSDAYRSTDVVVVANGFRYEELLVLRDSSAPAEFAWLVELPRGLHGPRREASGALVFDDVKGEAVLRVPAAWSIDASGVKRAVELDWKEGRLVARPDLRGVTWPVAVDPAIETAVWEDRSPAPFARFSAAMAYDSARGRTVLFGGRDGPSSSAPASDTWEWDGMTWTLRATAGPAARSAAAMAYDSARGRIVLYGGRAGSNYLGDTWEWDGTAWVQTATTGPGARSAHAMAYDSSRGRTVLFGGVDGLGKLGDTWEWDGAAWTKVAATGPIGRDSHALAYDRARGRTVLFGGSAGGAETWEWDGTTWTQRATTGPEARSAHAMAYDSGRGRTVLFGGSAGGAETWEWDGTTWTQIATTGPSQRQAHTMVYDSTRGRTVLFGGQDASGKGLGDTWESDGSSWAQTTTPSSAPARYYHVMGYDSARGRTVLFGGSGLGPIWDTWEWDGTTWTKMATVGPSLPPSGYYTAALTTMAYDSGHDRTVFFGGENMSNTVGDTWEWDGTTWTELPVAGPSGCARRAMAYDSARGRIVLFGGERCPAPGYLSDTWEWDGTSWTKVAIAGPSTRVGHAMAYDSARERTVLFGGSGESGYPSDTWEWDGTSWTQMEMTGPSPRSAHAMAYDSARERTVLFGGSGASGTLGDTWEWDGTDWTQMAMTGPSPRSSLAMAYDSGRRRTVLFGGRDGAYPHGDTWEYHTHGGACSEDSACDTGHCVDGVCCEQAACPGTCQQCNGTTPGLCSAVANEQDPDTCTGVYTCSAAGACLLADGQPSTVGTACASGNSVDGLCCASASCGTCQGCNLAGHLGTCTHLALGLQDLDSCSAAGLICNGAGACKKVNAQPCSAGSECISDSCVDSVCCESAGCTTCQACNLAGNPGVCVNLAEGLQDLDSCSGAGQFCNGAGACKTLDGYPCSAATDCLGGHCVDSTCCASASCGICQACNVAAHPGTCTNLATGLQDPDTCSAVGTACNGAGVCKKLDGQTCSTGQECLSGSCADGRCCNSACSGGCDVCNASPGQCTVLSPGSPGADPSCSPYLCSGSPQCPTTCFADADCAEDYFCDAAGHCASRKAQGDGCDLTAGSDCRVQGCRACGGTLSCKDAVCCSASCTGTCQTCAAPAGLCTLVANADDTDTCTGASTCDASGACKKKNGQICGLGVECASGFCVDGYCCNTPCAGNCDVCNATPGMCTFVAAGSAGTPTCTPYLCTGSSADCGSTCASDTQCISSWFCDGTSHCAADQANGATCISASQCQSGYCVDGVCCNQACDGSCLACSAVLKASGADGTCGYAAFGKDPHDSCSADSPSTCQKDGQCDGAGACRLYAVGTSCGSTTCTGNLVKGQVCDGQGLCTIDTTGTDCAPYICQATGCAIPCAADAQCTSGNWCDQGTCKPKVANGTPCSGSNACETGFCVEGVCCDTSCSGLCQACKASSKGSGSDGTCDYARDGADPHSDCTDDGSTTCKQDGMCNGDGQCRLYTSGTACGNTSCVNNAVTGYACDGNGTCATDTTDCGAYLCKSATCTTSCTTEADCASGAWCSAGSCVLKTPAGESCTSGDECPAGFCVDGVCCESACTLQCEACNLVANKGNCLPVTGDPQGGREPCVATSAECAGSCNGTNPSACTYPGTSKTCDHPACSGGQATTSSCDGQGACAANTPTSCSPYACSATACKDTCATDTDCATGFRCNTSTGKCAPPGSAVCDGDHTLVSEDAPDQDCSPYKCSSANVCMTACTSRADCVDTATCSTDGRCQPVNQQPPAASDTGCGCRTAAQRGGAGGLAAAMLLFAGSLISARRRTKRRGRARGSAVICGENARSARRPNP